MAITKLGGQYSADPHHDLFIAGIDGEAEFASLNQTHRVDEAITEANIESVIIDGIISPIVVRRRKDGRFEVIDGRQRTRWARLANHQLTKDGRAPIVVPVVVQATKEVDARRIANVTNYHRVDPSPMQLAEDVWRECQILGEKDPADVSAETIAKVAVSCNRSPGTIRNALAINRLTPGVQAIAAQRLLTTPQLTAIAALPEDAQQAEADRLVDLRASGATSAEVTEAARAVRDSVEDGGPAAATTKKKKKKKAKAAEDDPGRAPLRRGQVLGILRLIDEDVKAMAGAGCDVDELAIRALKLCAGLPHKPVKGITELLNRLASGE